MEESHEFGRLLAWADRRLFFVHDEQVDVLDEELIQELGPAIVATSEFQLALCSAQSEAKVSLVFERITGPAPIPAPPAEIIGQGRIEFCSGRLVVTEIASGAQGPVVLPDGPGVYQVTVSTDRRQRESVAAAAAGIYQAADHDLERVRELAQELTGREWYRLRFQRVGDAADDEDDA